MRPFLQKELVLKLVRFYRDGELSSMQMSSVDETIMEVNGLFFDEQIVEEQINLEIYSKNRGKVSEVDELRLDFDRIMTRKQLQKRALISGYKFIDSANYEKAFSINTILNIKAEQRYLNATFKGFYILVPRSSLFKKSQEPLLFASLKNDNFYLLNADQIREKKSRLKSAFNWIQKKISSKTSSKL